MNIDDDYHGPTLSSSSKKRGYEEAHDTFDHPSSWFYGTTKVCGECLELSTGEKFPAEESFGFGIIYSNLPSDLAGLF